MRESVCVCACVWFGVEKGRPMFGRCQWTRTKRFCGIKDVVNDDGSKFRNVANEAVALKACNKIVQHRHRAQTHRHARKTQALLTLLTNLRILIHLFHRNGLLFVCSCGDTQAKPKRNPSDQSHMQPPQKQRVSPASSSNPLLCFAQPASQ